MGPKRDSRARNAGGFGVDIRSEGVVGGWRLVIGRNWKICRCAGTLVYAKSERFEEHEIMCTGVLFLTPRSFRARVQIASGMPLTNEGE